jgi:LuxR family maltose regulon positive regulatory protein
MRAFVADVAGDTSRAIELASLADGLLAPSELMLKFLLPYIMGKAYRYQGKLDLAEKCARQGIEISRKAKSLFSMAGVMHELVLVSRLQGRLREASKLVDDFEALPKEPGDEGPTVKVLADRAEVERERGDLASAEATMATVLQNVHRWGLPSDMYFCHMMKCRIELSAGRPDSAAKDVEYADQLTRASMVYSSMFPSLEAERVRTLLARGMLPAARAWMEEYRFPDEGSRVNRELILMTRARVLTADGRAREALSSLASLAAEAEAGGRGGRLLEILVLQAAAFLAAGDGDAAGASLRRALVLAEPEGYCRVFLDEGEPIRTLLYRLAESREGLEPHLSDFARRLSR